MSNPQSMDASKSENPKNPSKRRVGALKDLWLLITFLVAVFLFLLVWFFFIREETAIIHEPELVEIIYAEDSLFVEEEKMPYVPRRSARPKEADTLSLIDHRNLNIESDLMELTETQNARRIKILSEVDVRLRQLELRKKYIRNHFQNFLFTRQNNYTQNENHGISNLYITLNNVSEFSIDLVEIEVQYIDPDLGIVHSETLFFTGIECKGQLSLRAPDSHRGKIISHFISRIHSKELEFCYSPDKWEKGSDDPYKCLNGNNND
jgi:hypothetical protein